MVWVDILIGLVLFFSLIGGVKEGAVKQFFSLVALIIAILLTGISYHLLSAVFSFLPGENWENFIGFFVTLALISIILYFVFLLPRRAIQRVWRGGVFFRLLGGAFSILSTAIGLVVFALLVRAYPVFGWLEQVVTESNILTWLVVHLGFVQTMLSGVLKSTAPTAADGPLLDLVTRM